MTPVVGQLTPDRLGELNLLLEAIELSGSNVRAVNRKVREMAGSIDQAPLPDDYLEICSRLQLIERSVEQIRLSSLGLRVKELLDPDLPRGIFSKEQALLIEPEVASLPLIDVCVQSVINRMYRWSDGIRRMRVGESLDEDEDLGIRILQSLHCVDVDNTMGEDFFTMSPDAFKRLSSNNQRIRRKTEQELWDELDLQREWAQIAEILVLKYEKQRLAKAGKQELSKAVFRISEWDVSAGYDISSYEIDGTYRYIEVKSSRSMQVRFFWGENERLTAKEKGEQYWVYFVPRVHELEDVLTEVTMINDPISEIGYSLSEVASNFEVTMAKRVDMNVAIDVGPTLVRTIVGD